MLLLQITMAGGTCRQWHTQELTSQMEKAGVCEFEECMGDSAGSGASLSQYSTAGLHDKARNQDNRRRDTCSETSRVFEYSVLPRGCNQESLDLVSDITPSRSFLPSRHPPFYHHWHKQGVRNKLRSLPSPGALTRKGFTTLLRNKKLRLLLLGAPALLASIVPLDTYH